MKGIGGSRLDVSSISYYRDLLVQLISVVNGDVRKVTFVVKCGNVVCPLVPRSLIEDSAGHWSSLVSFVVILPLERLD